MNDVARKTVVITGASSGIGRASVSRCWRRGGASLQVGRHSKLLVTLPRILPGWLLDAIVLRTVGMPAKAGTV